MKPFNAFITGATGFIGRWVLLKLVQRGYTVGALSRQPDKDKTALVNWLKAHNENPEQLQIVQGDMSHPNLGLSSASLKMLSKVQDVYNLAAATGWGLDYDHAHQVNVSGPILLLDLLATNASIRRFIHITGYMAGTGRGAPKSAEYEKQKTWTKDEWYKHSKHIGSYESTKMQAHFAIQQKCQHAKIPFTIVNPGGLIGDSNTGEILQTQSYGILSLMNQIWKKQMIAIPGKPGDWIPLVSVDYLASYIIGLSKLKETAGQEYWVLDKKTPTLKGLIEIIATYSNRKAPRFYIPIFLARFFLKLGLSRLTGLSPESLSYITSNRFITQDEEALAKKLGLVQPDIKKVLIQTIAYYMKTKYRFSLPEKIINLPKISDNLAEPFQQ